MEWIKKQLGTRAGTIVLLIIASFFLGASNSELVIDVYRDYKTRRDSTEIVFFNSTLYEIGVETNANSYKYDHLKETFKTHQLDDIKFRDRLDVKFESIDKKQDAIISQLERLIGALHGQGIRVAEGD